MNSAGGPIGDRARLSFDLDVDICVVGAGLAAGAAIGLVVAYVLVRELEGVFDPPPESLSIPWPYLATLVVTALVSVAIVVLIAARAFDQRRIEALRDS